MNAKSPKVGAEASTSDHNHHLRRTDTPQKLDFGLRKETIPRVLRRTDFEKTGA